MSKKLEGKVAVITGGNSGLGYMINLARQEFDTATIFAAIIVIIAFVHGMDRYVLGPLQVRVDEEVTGPQRLEVDGDHHARQRRHGQAQLRAPARQRRHADAEQHGDPEDHERHGARRAAHGESSGRTLGRGLDRRTER